MADLKSITIIGGGLAGLSLGIGLRQRRVPVTIWEAAHYPRHRVCGEFISGRGQQYLRQLGVFDQLWKSGAVGANTVCFFSRRQASAVQALPEPALGISRYTLDGLLAAEFERAGGVLKTNTRWKEEFNADGVVRATGRRIHNQVEGWRWFGLKIHARNVDLLADLEMHFTSRGYVGICRLANEVNICGLFRSRNPAVDLQKNWREWLCGDGDSVLQQRLARASFDESSFTAVAGLSLQRQRATDFDECIIGDSLTMIPPVTGNGMSMAFESAQLAVDPIERYARSKLTWEQTRLEIAASCDKRFKNRLKWAGCLQKALFQKFAGEFLIFAGLRFARLPLLFFEKTR